MICERVPRVHAVQVHVLHCSGCARVGDTTATATYTRLAAFASAHIARDALRVWESLKARLEFILQSVAHGLWSDAELCAAAHSFAFWQEWSFLMRISPKWRFFGIRTRTQPPATHPRGLYMCTASRRRCVFRRWLSTRCHCHQVLCL